MLSIFREYRHLLRPVRFHFAAAVFFGMVYSAASGFGIPFMTQKVLPVLFPVGERGPLVLARFPDWLGWPDWTIPTEHVMAFAVLLLPTAFFLRAVSQFLKEYLMNYCGLRVLEGLRMHVFEKIQTLHLDFFRKISSGDLSQRLSGDTAVVRYALMDVIGDLITQPFLLISSFSYVLYASTTQPGMSRFVISLLIVPATILPIRFVSKNLRKRALEAMNHAGRMNAMLVESIQAPREIRSYNLQQREITRYRDNTAVLMRLSMKLVKYEKALSPVIEFIAACSISFAIWAVAKQADTPIRSEHIVALVAALYFCYDPIKKLGGVNNKLKQSAAALVRIDEIVKATVEVADSATPEPMPEPRGEIRFDGVTFAYSGGETVFENTSISIAPGEIVALVGESGSGKSTFANLVPRFYDPNTGRVFVDGADVRTVAQAELRSRIALVSQEPILFDDTIAANLRIGKPDATDEELAEAARNAGALDFILAQPQGFATRVGERGGLLSGGQRQRLSIARAFLKNAPILILDEATSALDSETEAQIQESLERLVTGKTVLIIAHRFSTIRFATRILVFAKAAKGIAADGPHERLMAESALYRNLYERQKFGDT